MDEGLPLYRCADVREIDRAAVEREGIPAYELMTRAAQASLELLRRGWPGARRIAIACGGGNNGGDGLVLARLARAAGLDVVVHVAAAPSSAEASRATQDWLDAGGTPSPSGPAPDFATADVVVDALLGIGLARAPRDAIAALIDAINASGRPVLALDVPSGLDADRGTAPGACVRATRTLSFVARKRGLHTGHARERCGTLAFADLDIADATRARAVADAYLLQPSHLRRWLPRRPRDAHKGHHGHVLAIGGEHGTGGAIRLCAEAALRSGAGLVSVATRAAHVAPLLSARPEAMVHAIEDGDALALLLGRADVVALGPGLGRGEWGRALCRSAAGSPLPQVLDADALNLLAEAPWSLPEQAVLTPHPGEAARLLGVDVAAIEADRFGAARALAERYRATVILKGAGALVAAPGRTPAVIGAGNPGMASGGSGDVLTGVVAALLAQGLEAFDAARAGALLHASAGDAAAAAGGERGLLAGDLMAHLRTLANPA